jgi:2-amino-4-hydroxy-6-hydroxymethyldihydropteridine diphosphokinase
LILLGSNEGNRQGFLQKATQAMAHSAGDIQKASSVYQSESWGFCAEVDFLNQAFLVDTALQPYVLLQTALAIETQLGRARPHNGGYASRCIDIDILFYDDRIISSHDLEIPHPRLHLRRFALVPTAEIAPDRIHPIFNKNVQALLLECRDGADVRLWSGI